VATIVKDSELLLSLRALVKYHHTCGIRGYLKNNLQESGLSAALVTLSSRSDQNIQDKKAEAVTPIKHKQDEQASVAVKGQSITELHAEISRCRSCSLHESRQIDTAGAGGETPRLLIVGDWFMVPHGSSVTGQELFGTEQDQMLKRMMTAIELENEDIFITNVIKCSLPETSQPTAEHITCCSSYLKIQIESLRPQLICSMGIIATRLFSGVSKPLSQVRGHFFSYTTGSGRSIPVMPTYHPTFLLQNPEMKQATWSDLQAIKQKLGSAGLF